jgi:hypothetical protein
MNRDNLRMEYEETDQKKNKIIHFIMKCHLKTL